MSNLKQAADWAMGKQDYFLAIDLYTEALNDSNGTGSLEDKRVLLANRSLAYMLHEDVRNALQDCDLALSSTYTIPDAPERLTAKCHFRRAKLRLKMAMYEEALEDFEAFERLHTTGGLSLLRVTDAEKAEVLNAVTQALREPLSDRDKLLRAVQARGILVPEMFLATFPRHPSNTTSGGQIMFDEGSITDSPELTMPFLIITPTLNNAAELTRRLPPYISVPERHTLQEYIPAIFSSTDIQHGNAPGIRSAASMLQVDNSQVLLCTRNGRILRIPWDMPVGDIWAGARWPRKDSDLPALEDLRQTPRARPHEVDGAHLTAGSYLDLFVLRNEEIESFVNMLDKRMAAIPGLGM